ncbi:MAG: carbamate kinase [Actinomycetota bacterium]|nr:carbamate kinase [Actinomycetota bacterium]
MRIVVALGGNAIQQRDDVGTAAEQRASIREACDALANLAREHELIVTHGNGPQVGLLLAQNEAAAPRLPEMPLDVLVAETQGMLGYMIQQELNAAFVRAGVGRQAVSVTTQVVVDASDPAFVRSSKPVGSFLSRAAAAEMRRAGITITEVSGGKWRRTVASPTPIRIVEEGAIAALVQAGAVPIVAGGGGIPVVAEGNGTRGVAAVIDKDRTAALLARTFRAGMLLILTDVDAVEIDGRQYRELGADHAALALANGVFPPGSMGPKIEAAVTARQAGIRVVIANLDKASEAVAGESGTEIT